MEEREQFTFYASFAKSIRRIRKAADRAAAYDAIVDYALNGIEPDLEKLPDIAAVVFEVSKPVLDASRRKAENGKKGGKAEADEKQEQPESKPEARESPKQTGSKPEANRKQEQTASKNKDKDKNKNKDKCLISPVSPSPAPAEANGKQKGFVPPTLEEVRAYVQENGYNVDADYFWKFYNTGDWIDGQGNPVRNWKQKLITWAKKDAEKPVKQKKYTTAEEYRPPESIDVSQLEKIKDIFG